MRAGVCAWNQLNGCVCLPCFELVIYRIGYFQGLCCGFGGVCARCCLWLRGAGLSVWVRCVSVESEGWMGWGRHVDLGCDRMSLGLFPMSERLCWMGSKAFWILGSSAAVCC